MISLFHPGTILLATSLLFASPDGQGEAKTSNHSPATIIQSDDPATLNELNALCSKQLRAAGLAAKQGERTKQSGNKAIVVLSSFSDELKLLTKKKSIQLAGTLPQGGQRPDGRVDSSPENLKDTSRLNNAGGEAGNSGTVKTTPNGLNDGANNSVVESLAKLNGNAFDSTYRNLLISDRPTAEKLLMKVAASRDKDIAAFASKYLNKLSSAKL